VGDGTFAARLKELREAAGLSQSQLAERAGMHRFGVSKLEQGLREPSWATVQAIASALGVSCESFQQPAAERPAAKPGRPPKGDRAGKGKGRKRKGE
jgi:transcriptional regulator with XRE-family HTH domain